MKTIYERLSSVKPLAKSYTVKFLFIAFLGIHIPLIGLIVFILFKPDSLDTFSVIGITLLLTLFATGITLFILNGLLSPLRQSGKALDTYLRQRILPSLPTHYQDEAGQLMQNVQFTLTELNDLLEEKRDLTSLLSHDLRIPMRNIKTFSQLLQRHNDEASVNEIAGMIYQSVEEQSSLLENILDILRQDHLFFEGSQFTKVEAGALIDETIASFEAVAKEKNITLCKDVTVSEPLEVQPELFSQVLKNLASNAIKFSYEGTKITFTARRQQHTTEIAVCDTGMGFEPAVAERLFDRFTKSGRMGTAGEPSTGIGLYLSRKIIKHHNGNLVATSEGAGKGSKFSILLN